MALDPTLLANLTFKAEVSPDLRPRGGSGPTIILVAFGFPDDPGGRVVWFSEPDGTEGEQFYSIHALLTHGLGFSVEWTDEVCAWVERADAALCERLRE